MYIVEVLIAASRQRDSRNAECTTCVKCSCMRHAPSIPARVEQKNSKDKL